MTEASVTGKVISRSIVDAEAEEIIVNVIGCSNGWDWSWAKSAEELAGGSVNVASVGSRRR